MAKPAQGFRYISAYSPKEPAVGWAAAISARAHIIGKAIRAPATKLRITAGPASLTAMALPRNRPVPMVLPRPSIASWTGVRLRCRPDSRATMVAGRPFSAAAGMSKAGSLMARHRSRNTSDLLHFDLNVRPVNACNTDCPSKRSRLIVRISRIRGWRGTPGGATEAVMKALLALIIIYIGTFFLVIQGSSQDSAQAAPQSTSAPQSSSAIDPAKEADIRSLMELVGARDLVQDGANTAIEQSREKLLATVPNNDKGQAFVNAFAASYQKKFDVGQVTNQLVVLYDKHFTDEEIKGLLQFYGSQLGQKVAAEMPKIGRETQAAVRAAAAKAAKDSLAELKQQNPEIGQSARLGNGQGQGRWQRRGQQRG